MPRSHQKRIVVVKPTALIRLLAAILLTSLVLLAACERQQSVVHLVGATMGTQYSVKVVNPGARDPDELRSAIDALLMEINAAMSTYLADSELSLLNTNGSTDWIAISERLYDVLQTALTIAAASDGAFDVTIGPLVNLWGFGPERDSQVPDTAAIEQARERVGVDKLRLRPTPPAVRKQRGDIHIDLSAIAKGYAVDEIAAYLESLGYGDYLVEIGGEIRAKGANQDGVPWRIGIENPVVDGREIGETVDLSGHGMASSGNYRNFFERDGIRYGHTIDPKTGRPTRHDLAAVTVIHPQAMVADAWATALMSLGFEDGFKLAEERGIAALFFVAAADTGKRVETRTFNIAIANK